MSLFALEKICGPPGLSDVGNVCRLWAKGFLPCCVPWAESVCCRGQCRFVLFNRRTLECEFARASGSLFQGKSLSISINKNRQNLHNSYYHQTLF